MMGILSFREWDGLNETMTYWTMNDLCSWDEKTEKPSALCEWEQSALREDENGVEIYRGDFIEAICIFNIDKETNRYVVEYNKDESKLSAREITKNKRGGRYWVNWVDLIEVEVVGDIHRGEKKNFKK